MKVGFHLTSNLFTSVVSALGSILPDLIEGYDFQTTSWEDFIEESIIWDFFL
jgi:hypothetical protein